MTQPTLFGDARTGIGGMVHQGDPPTSKEAAQVIARRQSELQWQVCEAFRQYGSMTDEELERLPCFKTFGPSTIRKRRSELYRMGELVPMGTEHNSRGRWMTVWGLKG